MVFLDGFIYAMVAAEGGTYQVLRKDTGTTPFASFTTGAPADVSAAGLYTDGSAVYAAYVNGEVYRVNPSSGNMALYENLASGGISPLFMSNDYGRSVFPPGIPMLLRRGVFYVGSAVGPVFSAD
jgi:hypothetical protein